MIDVTISWQQVITIAVTQAIASISMFYTLKGLGMLHNGEKKRKKKK